MHVYYDIYNDDHYIRAVYWCQYYKFCYYDLSITQIPDEVYDKMERAIANYEVGKTPHKFSPTQMVDSLKGKDLDEALEKFLELNTDHAYYPVMVEQIRGRKNEKRIRSRKTRQKNCHNTGL